MGHEELLAVQKQQPFTPFRLVLNDGTTYEVRHPDLMMVGLHSAMIGFTRRPEQILFERSVEVGLQNVVRLEPLESQGP